MGGWIKLHRSLTRWEWYSDHNTTRLFVHLLMSVNSEIGYHQGLEIPVGCVKTGRKELARQTGLSEQQIRRSLNNLQTSQDITIKPTNKFSLITIVKWGEYQSIQEKATNKRANKQPANAPDNNHKQEVKNILYADFLKRFNHATDKRCRVVDEKTKRQLRARIKEGFTVDEIIKAAEFCSNDEYHKKHRHYLTPEFITRSDKLIKYLPSNSQSTAFRQNGQNFAGQPLCNGLTQEEHIAKYGSLNGDNHGRD